MQVKKGDGIVGKLNNIGYYRIELEKHQATARKLVLDEIEA